MLVVADVSLCLQTYLCVTDKSADAAAYMLARFLTRPDVKKRKLKEVLEWAISTLTAGAGRLCLSVFMGIQLLKYCYKLIYY